MSALRIEGIDDVLEFEDIFEIITPGTIERRVQNLNTAWKQLAKDSPKVKFIQAEYAKWNEWAKSVLDSWTSRLWLSTQKDLESWQKRYKTAYAMRDKNSLAPIPDNLSPPENVLESPVFWTVAGIAIVVGVYLYARTSK